MKDLTNLLSQNGSFMTYTFLHLISQLLITFCVIYTLRSYPNVTLSLQKWYWYLVMFILVIMITFGIYSSNLSIPVKIVLFTLFSCIFGLMLSFSLNKIPYPVINSAILGALSIFVVMLFSGYIITSYGYDLSWLGGVLLVSLIAIIISSIFCYVFGVSSGTHRFYLFIGLIVYSIFILYDTNIILRKNYKGDFVASSFSYYVDIIGVFIRLAELFNKN